MSCKKHLARIIGTGMTALRSGKAAKQQPADAVTLMVEALQLAVRDAGIPLSDLDTLIALPSLMSEHQFMIGHAVAQQASLTPRRGMLVKTMDVGGAGPVAALLAAKHAIEHEGRKAVAIVAGDTVASVPVHEFLARADASCRPAPCSKTTFSATTGSLTIDSVTENDFSSSTSSDSSSSSSSFSSSIMDSSWIEQPAPSPRGLNSCSSSTSAAGGWTSSSGPVPSPVIPNLYDQVARWHMQQYGTTRQQLAMCASLMTYQASRHPAALHKRPRLLQEVIQSPQVGLVTTQLECAKLADGAAAMVLVGHDSRYSSSRGVCVIGGGEGSGPLSPPAIITEDCFSAADAAAAAYKAAACTPADIHYWGLYDCFPLCLIRAIEAVGLAPKCQGGHYIQSQYDRLLGPLEEQHKQQQQQQHSGGPRTQRTVWPVNTHGGLLGFGAPWEVPAMHSLIEAVAQLRGEAVGRQVLGAKRALVYGNGGIFSASAVAILQSQGVGAVSKL